MIGAARTSAGRSRTHPIQPERRVITVLAVDIVGSTRHIADCDPDDAQLFFDRCFEHMRRMIAQAGGTLVSFEGDGGIAAFGWPDALEDHADRACAAAWLIQHGGDVGSGPTGRPVQFRVGVHSGLVALRRIRQGGRSQLNTVGATVHIAAKLQQSARPGGILVSGDAARLCRSRLELTPQPLAPALDGAGTDAFSLEARPEKVRNGAAALRYPTPMIGRQSELAAVRKAYPEAGGGNAIVALIGEPGIGKSRLAAAVMADGAARGVKLLTFRGESQKRTTPFAAARGLIEESLDLSSGSLREEERRALARSGFEAGELAAVERLLSAPQGKPRSKRVQLTETQIARLLVRAFSALVIDRPSFLLVEDLHLIDAESRQFLRMLAAAETVQPLLLLLTGRPEFLEEAREIAADGVLTLEPLPRNAMKALGQLLWPEGRAPGAMLDRVVDRADGIPFVLEELVHAVGSQAGSGAAALPHGVESLIHARLHRLSPGARSLAQALSLLGESVDLALAGKVSGREPASLVEDLAELERFAFVHPPQGHAVRMRHQIISDACADTIPRQQRRQLHRAAIDAITSLHANLDGRYEQLAFHAEGAGDETQALDYLWEAALEARRSSAAASLNLILDRAIGLVERIGAGADERYVDFVLMAFAAMLQLGEFDKMNLHLPRVMKLVRKSGQPALICSALSQVGMIAWFDGRYEEGLQASEEGLAIARELDSPALIFSNQLMLASNLHGLGRVKRAIEESRELCDLLAGDLATARLGAPGVPSAIVRAFLGWFLIDAGDYREGLDVAEAGLAIATREDDPYSQILGRNSVGQNLLAMGRNEEAAESFSRAFEIATRDGYDAIKPNLLGHLASALSRIGRAEEALGLVEDCLAQSLHLRTGQLERFYLHQGHAETLLSIGQLDEGLAALGQALEIARRINNPCLIADALDLRARMMRRLKPGDASIEEDLSERDAHRSQYRSAARMEHG